MRGVKRFLLIVLLGLLLVQVALAASAAKDAKASPAPPKETAKATKDTPAPQKEAAKEPVTPPKATKEAPKETVKEVPPKAPVKETLTEPPKAEVPKAAPKDASKEIPKEAPKAAPKETPKEAPKAAPKETPKEVPKEAPKAAQKETPKTAPKETPKAAPKETPKAAPKETSKTAPKEVPKANDVPRFPKETQKKGDSKPVGDGSFMGTYEYGQQAYDVAGEYGQVAWKEAKKYGGSAAVLAQEYSVVMADAVKDYTDVIKEQTYKHSVDLVDKVLDPQHAKIVKKNYLNWYGVGIILADILAIIFVVRHLKWVFTLSTLRVFLVATSLGVHLTLATLSILGENPTSGISASTLASIHQGLFYTSVVITALNIWAVLAYPSRQRSFIVALLSVGLFVDQLELRSNLEDAVGTIPAYSLEALVLLLQAILVFDSISPPIPAPPPLRVIKTTTTTTTPKPSASGTYIKEEKVKQEKVKKSPKIGGK